MKIPKLKAIVTKVKKIFKRPHIKKSQVKKDMHTYGFAFKTILETPHSPQIKLKKLKYLKKSVVDITNKRLKGLKDHNKRLEEAKDYIHLLNKILIAETKLSEKIPK